METQNLTPEFRKFIATVYNPNGERPHDRANSDCKCGGKHSVTEFLVMLVSEFKKTAS